MINTKIRAQVSNWCDSVSILIEERTTDNRRSVATNITMATVKEGEMIQPSMELSKTSAQLLMDDLWHAGLRPSEGSGSAGSLRATERHLSDMRKIVSKNLEVDL
jgi:hypothetical protein